MKRQTCHCRFAKAKSNFKVVRITFVFFVIRNVLNLAKGCLAFINKLFASVN